MRNTKQYSIEKSPLFRLSSHKKLADILGFTSASEAKIFLRKPFECKKIFVSNDQKVATQYKQKNEKPLVKTKTREALDPPPEVKKMQQRLLKLFMRIETPEWLFSSKKSLKNLDNTLYHKDSKSFILVDIKKFFPSCKREFVFQMFLRKFEMPPDIAYSLTEFVTLDDDNLDDLPTGFPTSQIIAFWAYYDAFEKINQIAKSNDMRFSLYVDDMTFSSTEDVISKEKKKLVLKSVREILFEYGLAIQEKKTQLLNKEDHKKITGAILTPDSKLTIPNRHQNIIRVLFYEFNQELNQKKKRKIAEALYGTILYAQSINPQKYTEIRKITFDFLSNKK